jgi:hypothetical protein
MYKVQDKDKDAKYYCGKGVTYRWYNYIYKSTNIGTTGSDYFQIYIYSQQKMYYSVKYR